MIAGTSPKRVTQTGARSNQAPSGHLDRFQFENHTPFVKIYVRAVLTNGEYDKGGWKDD